MPQAETLTLNADALTIEQVEAVARGGRAVALGEAARSAVQASRAVIEIAVSGSRAIYGVNTGFGSLSKVRVESRDLESMQENIIRSHAAGVGEPLPDEVVRGMMLLLAASLGRGHSGVRVEVVERIIAMLNAGITPVVPSRGSVGASGDLAPLAHAALAMLGEGQVRVRGNLQPAAEALAAANITPLKPQAKEGLALLNGTHMMAAIGALAVSDALRLIDGACVAAAMAVDAARGSDSWLDARIHAVRRQPGQVEIAKLMRGLLEGSQIVPSHRDDDPRVQDPYCLRASPQVLGAALDAIARCSWVVNFELGAVTDNPLVFPEQGGEILSGGNFHGMPLAIAFDHLKIALCHIAGIAERRIFWVLSGHDPEARQRPHLAATPGLSSGYMIVQYTAAACCNELQVLAHPASVGNISTSAGIEDYNSMGATAALHTRMAIERATDVVAMELLCMAQGIESHRPLRSGAGVERALALLRTKVAPLDADRSPAPDIVAVAALVRAGAIANAR